MVASTQEDLVKKAWATAGRIASLARALVGGTDAHGKNHLGATPRQISAVAQQLQTELDRYDGVLIQLAGAKQ